MIVEYLLGSIGKKSWLTDSLHGLSLDCQGMACWLGLGKERIFWLREVQGGMAIQGVSGVSHGSLR